MFSMKPEPDDSSISIPITFDYKGGRNENKRNQIFATIIIVVLTIVLVVGVFMNDDKSIVNRLLIDIVILVVSTTFLRFCVFKETVYSDIFESLKEVDFMPSTSCFWTIYDIDYTYPYICHYMNGLKGIFVRMEKDVIVGKSDNVMYNHFEGISEAYNLASSMNVNLYHIDYMDNVGNDPRLKQMYDDLKDVENSELQGMMLDIYQNLQDVMSRDYSSFDVYVFFTKDRLENFIYNVQQICNEMLGGNFVSYKILDVNGIRQSCMALLNLEDFSVINASELLLKNHLSSGVVPISIEHSDGSVEKFNKTTEEKRIELEEKMRREQELKEEAKKNKGKNKSKKKVEPKVEEDVVEQKVEDKIKVEDFEVKDIVDKNEDLNLF